jgi:hypothetical protein
MNFHKQISLAVIFWSASLPISVALAQGGNSFWTRIIQQKQETTIESKEQKSSKGKKEKSKKRNQKDSRKQGTSAYTKD